MPELQLADYATVVVDRHPRTTIAAVAGAVGLAAGMAIMYLLAPNSSAEGHQQEQQQQQGRSYPYHTIGPGSQAADDFDAHSTFGGSIMEEPDTPRFMDGALPNGTPQLRRSTASFSQQAAANSPIKLVYVVRRDLDLSLSSLVSNCSQAGLSAYKKRWRIKCPVLKQWEQASSPRTLMAAEDEHMLLSIKERAKQANVPYHTLVTASGRAIMALGPWHSSQLDPLVEACPPFDLVDSGDEP